MLVLNHFLFAIPFTLILYPFFQNYSLIVLFAAFLIDIDHYLVYIFKFRSISFKKAYVFFKSSEEGNKFIPGPFHAIELILLASFLFYKNKIISLILIGFIFHIITDMFHNLYFQKTARPFSIIHWIFNRDKYG